MFKSRIIALGVNLGTVMSNENRSTKPQHSNATAQLTQAYRSRGHAFSQQRKWEEAENTYKKGIDLNNIPVKQQAEFCLYLVEVLIRQDKLIEAEETCNKAIQLIKSGNLSVLQRATLYERLGFILGQQGKWGEAETQYIKCLMLKNASVDHQVKLYFFFGEALREQGKLIKAEEAYNKVIQLIKLGNLPVLQQAMFYERLGFVLAQQNSWSKAEYAYKNSLALKNIPVKQQITRFFYLGTVLKKQNKFIKAEEAYSKGVRLIDQNASVTKLHIRLYNAHGDMLYELGRIKDALASWDASDKFDRGRSEQVRAMIEKRRQIYASLSNPLRSYLEKNEGKMLPHDEKGESPKCPISYEEMSLPVAIVGHNPGELHIFDWKSLFLFLEQKNEAINPMNMQAFNITEDLFPPVAGKEALNKRIFLVKKIHALPTYKKFNIYMKDCRRRPQLHTLFLRALESHAVKSNWAAIAIMGKNYEPNEKQHHRCTKFLLTLGILQLAISWGITDKIDFTEDEKLEYQGFAEDLCETVTKKFR